MPRDVQSPVKEFPGHIILPDFLTLAQVFAFEAASDNVTALKGGTIRRSQIDAEYLPMIFAIVTEWHIDGQPDKPTLETWRATPRKASADLTAWAIGEITKMYLGEIEIPNA